MYFLLKCGMFYVLPSSKIVKINGKKCFAKFRDGRYEADIIDQGGELFIVDISKTK